MTGREQVVLLDDDHHPIGTAPKDEVHSAATPLHLAFSCYGFDKRGRLLMTQRSLAKRTWPGFWTNTCCGHPAPGEAMVEAIHRRLKTELNLDANRLEVALPHFRYRASHQGVEENEVCPVFLAEIAGEPQPDPSEVEAWTWVAFEDFCARDDLSPWASLQRELLHAPVHTFLKSM